MLPEITANKTNTLAPTKKCFLSFLVSCVNATTAKMLAITKKNAGIGTLKGIRFVKKVRAVIILNTTRRMIKTLLSILTINLLSKKDWC